MSQTTHRSGISYMVAATFFFSVMTVMVKYVGQEMPSGQIVFIRSALALIFTLEMMRRAGVRPGGSNIVLLLLRGLSGFGALACFYYAIPRINLADVTVIQFTNPVFVAVLAALFLGEKAGVREAFSIVVCLIGVALIARPAFLFGNAEAAIEGPVLAIALSGAILTAAAYVSVRKLRETDHALNVILYFPLVSVPASIPLFFDIAVWPSPRDWVLLVGIAVTSQIGQILLTKSYHSELATRVSAVSYTQILFATIWGVVFFDEVPTLWLIAGAVLVGVGTMVVAIQKR